eukprot:SAG11_NODE_8097_length_1060_cov_3.034339_1_plen_238_part_00
MNRVGESKIRKIRDKSRRSEIELAPTCTPPLLGYIYTPHDLINQKGQCRVGCRKRGRRPRERLRRWRTREEEKTKIFLWETGRNAKAKILRNNHYATVVPITYAYIGETGRSMRNQEKKGVASWDRAQVAVKWLRRICPSWPMRSVGADADARQLTHSRECPNGPKGRRRRDAALAATHKFSRTVHSSREGSWTRRHMSRLLLAHIVIGKLHSCVRVYRCVMVYINGILVLECVTWE